MVDWSLGAMSGDYTTVRNRVPETAVVVAQSINFLILNNFINYENCVIIGHSFGTNNISPV